MKIKSRMELSSFAPELEKVFKFVLEEKIEDLTSYILNEENEIWNLTIDEDLTVLHKACAYDKTKVIEAIIEQTKIRLKLTSNFSLPQQIKIENEEIFKNFINRKTKGDNQTALHYASFRGNIKVINLLIENYANINAIASKGYNMIHKAAQGNKPSAIVYFNKKYNMSLETTYENSMNALHLASVNGLDNSVIFLLCLGIDPNLTDKNGYTALHYAVQNGHARIVKKLLQKGADRNIREKNYHRTPVDMAKKNPEIQEIFRKKGFCEKLFFKPDISQKTLYSNKNMIFFIILHLLIISLVFFVIIPDFENIIFAIIYLCISGLVFILYFFLSFSDPGIMRGQYKDLLSIVEQGEQVENFCPYCLVKKRFRSKHCIICEKCVDEFDHHCFWVGNCIGKNNYNLFFIFLIYILLNTLFNAIINVYFLINEIKNEEGEQPGFPYYFDKISFIYQFWARIIVSICCFVICILFFIPLVILFKRQLPNAFERRKLKKNEIKEINQEVWKNLVPDEKDNDTVELVVHDKKENNYDINKIEPLLKEDI